MLRLDRLDRVDFFDFPEFRDIGLYLLCTYGGKRSIAQTCFKIVPVGVHPK